MGVAPEAIVKKLILSIGSKTMCRLSFFFERISSFMLLEHNSIKSSGACSTLQMVVAPEAIAKYLRV
jgi:hypothetical protein